MFTYKQLLAGFISAVATLTVGAGVGFAQDFKLGLLTSMTGTLAPVGKQVRWGTELAADEINAKGGILGRKIAITLEDDESNPQVAARKAERLYQDVKVEFITGTIHSGGTLAVGQIAEREKKLMATTVSYSTNITGSQCNPYMFRVNAHAGIQAAAMVAWLAKNVKGDRYLILGPDYEMGRNAIDMFAKEVERNGKKVVETVFPPLGATDFSTYFGRIRAARPDVLLTMTPGNDTVRLLTQMKEFGLLPAAFKMGGAAGAVTAGNIGAMGGAAEGFITGASYSADLDTPDNKAFVAKFKAKYTEDPDLFAVDSYSLVYLIKAAAEKASSLDAEALRKAMPGMNWDTPQGRKTMRKEDNQASLNMYVIEVKGKGFKVIGTIPAAEIKIPDECTKF
jgi:branched-chain amino acid transport system substrate-binding protein